MSNNLKVFILSLTIVAILVFSAFGTTGIVYADGDTPPVPTDTSTPVADDGNPPAVTETPLPTEEIPAVVTETPVPAEQDPTEQDPTVEAPIPDVTTEVTPVTEDGAAADNSTPILEQLPENTSLTVLDANGEVLPLATQASVDAIYSA